MKTLRWPSVVLIALVFALAGASALWIIQRAQRSTPGAETASAPRTVYHCPMHPSVVSDRPGDCPICGMRLVPLHAEPETTSPGEDSSRAAAGAAPPGEAAGSGSNQAPDSPPEASPGSASSPSGRAAQGEAPPGLASVTIPPAKQELIGARTSLVEPVPFRREIRAVGRVAYDETLLHHVHAKFSGYIERLWANQTGTHVRRGQPLLEIYSPEILASQQDYLIALATSRRLSGSSLPSVAAPAQDLVTSARRRLELFDITKEQIEELERTGEPRRAVTLYAPMSGSITSREVTEGQMIDTGTTIL